MKTILLLSMLCLQVSAAALAQQISLNYTNAPLRQVLQEVRKQSGYSFFLKSDDLKTAKPVTVSLNKVTIEQTLQSIFEAQPFSYEIDGKTILIKTKAPSILQKIQTFFSAIDVRGRVTDEEGNALPGASVKSGNKATITNGNGEFTLSGIDENAMLDVSYIGYKSTSVKANKQLMKITLALNTSDLNEVVIGKGYYNTTKALNTGNVSTVLAKDLAKNNVGDPLIAMQGRVPGMYIAQTSGVTGSNVSVKLRGQNSIANGINPLYIVDGVPFPSIALTLGSEGGAAGFLSPFAALSVDNIERIDVLKDADATAIYGSRGANGVILITTKKGQQGQVLVNANVYSGAGKVSKKLDLMNTEQYLDMRRQALANDGITIIPTAARDLNGDYGDVNKYTDWQKVFIGGTAHLTDANASVSGGSAETSFDFGGGYRRETTVYPGDYQDRKATFHANVNHQHDRFKTSFSFSYLNDNNHLPQTDLTSRILLAPNAPALFTEDGKWNWQNSKWVNPLWTASVETTTVTENLNGSLNLNYEIIKGLNITTRAGYNDIRTNYNSPQPYLNYDPAVTIQPTNRTNAIGNNRVKTWIIEPGINYSKSIGKSKFESLIGATFQQTDQNNIAQIATGFSSPASIQNIQAASSITTNGFNDNRYRYNAIYARLAYNYADEYLINFTGRRDASSRFGPGRQFANLGAVGAAWIFSKQNFFAENLPVLSFGKIRASYGITGNDQLPDYKFLSTYSSVNGSYQGLSSINPTSLTNPNFGWETVKKLEAGLELGFLNDRIYFSGSWYRNRTGNQLVGFPLPAITGFNTINANLPAVIQNSGTEFEISGDAIKQNGFSWKISGNLSIPKNKLVSYPNIMASPYATRYVVGQPLFLRYLFQYTGIDASGVYTVEDLNKDGQITFGADQKPFFLGQKFFGSLNNTFTYKGFSLDLFVNFVKQNAPQFILATPGVFNANAANASNQKTSVMTGVANGTYQKYTQSTGTAAGIAYSRYTQSNAVLGDASFIRLKNVSLSWMLPAAYQQALHLKNARIYLQMQNLFTITNYNGLDPEVAGASSVLQLPTLRMITAGIQISL